MFLGSEIKVYMKKQNGKAYRCVSLNVMYVGFHFFRFKIKDKNVSNVNLLGF